jgi:catechol 2,3-dioxygenase-like lactoylglutathione lyase family enzyme
MNMIRGLHHSVYRCRNSEQTRRFYEDFLGLPLAGTMEILETKTGRATHALHTFYELGDGSYLAFFEVPDMPFDFKRQHDFDLHIALEIDEAVLQPMLSKARLAGHEARGISDHEFIRSIYIRDPNGYVVELTARLPGHDAAMNPAANQARAILDRWEAGRRERTLANSGAVGHG